jgi:hypothetical protein
MAKTEFWLALSPEEPDAIQIICGFTDPEMSADGRFLINTPIAASASTSSPITVIVNWTAGLKK